MRYTAHNLHTTHHLHYGWCAWPSNSTFPNPPPDLKTLTTAWENDGLKLLEKIWKPGEIKMTFKALPNLPPTLFTQRVKGRLQHALRQAGTPTTFSRKVTMRSLGENTRNTVEHYIEKQTVRETFADPRFARLLEDYAITDPAIDLALPTETGSGRYWYNLHLVLVVAGRYRFGERHVFERMRGCAMRVCKEQGYGLARLAIMPDHLHLALRGNLEQTPEEMGLMLQNELAIEMGRFRVWEPGFYVGSFSEYDLSAIRHTKN